MMPTGAAWGRGGGGGPGVLVGPKPLNQIPVPVPFDNAELGLPQFAELKKYIKDVPSAVALGKALFWDMQVGSDGKTACATCHFKAGADIRLNNTVNPGKDGVFSSISSTVPMGPNYTLNTTFYPAGDFPFFQVVPATSRVGVDTLNFIDPITQIVTAQTATITRSFDEVVGSQGVLKTNFVSIVTGTSVETGTPVLDTVFNIGGGTPGNLRQVTGRNTPSVINAVFNYANFWDGRADNIFNGVTPIGPLDLSAQIWINTGGTLTQQKVAIPNASLASQAVGPPLSDVEMSYHGRTFPDLGRKMINNGLIPLGQQHVNPNDSVLGGMINGGVAPGLNTTYEQMIKAAFQPDLTTNSPIPGGSGFTQIEANFSLFWGLSIMLYEATLVSDRSPFDRFVLGNVNAVNPAAQRGSNTFGSKCLMCHSGSEFTSAVIGSDLPGCILPDCNPVTFVANNNHSLLQFNQTNMLGALSDTGFFNITLRPTADDGGRGGVINFPLSFSRLAKLQDQIPNTLPFETPFLLPGTNKDTPDAIQGSFKTPGLRNVELNPPYFHNGSVFTLDQVVEFYTRGGNFPFNAGGPTGNPFDPTLGNPEQALAFQALGKLRGDALGRLEIVEFLKSLTDERVRHDYAPFDHPEIFIPDGAGENHLPATGGIPASPSISTFNINPVVTPTIVSFQTISGAVIDGSVLNDEVTVAVDVNGLVSAATVTHFIWTFDILTMPIGTNNISVTATNLAGVTTQLPTTSIVLLPTAVVTGGPQNVTKATGATLTVGGAGVSTYQYKVDGVDVNPGDHPISTQIVLNNLADGLHTVTVLGKDGTNQFQQPLASPTTLSWIVKSTPPVLTLNQVPPTVPGSLTVSGTVDLGIIPEVLVNKTATIGPISIVSGSWSCQISGLKNGAATITVIATDIAFNQTQKTASVNVILRDGAFKGTGVTDITDAVKALRFAVNLAAPSSDDMMRGDVAPLSAPDGKIDVDDALLILKKVVGLVSF
jgi:cytochrome c peroxidase